MSKLHPTNKADSSKRIVVIGGCGHVGLPLGITLRLAGFDVTLVDISNKAVEEVNKGNFPFLEENGPEQLQAALAQGLKATTDLDACDGANVFVFVTGTPVDEHLNPRLSDVLKIFSVYEKYLTPNCTVIMRSTLFPGTMEHLKNRLASLGFPIRLSFCPERVAQGYALREINDLPQIVSAFDEDSFEAGYEIFSQLAPEIIRLTPLEAELTKLMANAWRYLEFAIANQFYMIAESNGVDFYKLFDAVKYKYPRAQGYKAPGFAAGPCLFKDTMQLASFFDHHFYLGHSAMLVNEGLATFAVERLQKDLGGSLWGKKVAILGMAFKANSDDTRESLSFRVKKGLEFAGAEVACHDPYLPELGSLDQAMKDCEGVIIGVPHDEYKQLGFTCPVMDVWGVFQRKKVEVLPGRAQQFTAQVLETQLLKKGLAANE